MTFKAMNNISPIIVYSKPIIDTILVISMTTIPDDEKNDYWENGDAR
jgi:hypothetical protein